MSTKITKTTSKTYSEETVEKTRWEKGWDTRKEKSNCRKRQEDCRFKTTIG